MKRTVIIKKRIINDAAAVMEPENECIKKGVILRKKKSIGKATKKIAVLKKKKSDEPDEGAKAKNGLYIENLINMPVQEKKEDIVYEKRQTGKKKNLKRQNRIQEERHLIKTGMIVLSREKKSICNSTGKICYSKRDAGEIINGCKRHRGNDHLGRNKNLPKRSYFCSSCGCFHLTHEPFLKSGIEKKNRRGEK